MSSELIFKDRDGSLYQPVRNHNRTTGRSAFRVKPAGTSNRAEEAIELDTIEEVAKAMLIDGLPARVKPLAGGTVNYIRFGGDKLVSYELDSAIAKRLDIPASAIAKVSPNSAVLERLRTRFMRTYPDFEQVGHFAAESGSYYAAFRTRVDQLLVKAVQHTGDATAIFEALLAASREQSRGARPPFFDGDVVWRTPRARDVDPNRFDAATATLLGPRLIQSQNARAVARATPERKLAASLS